MRSVLLWPDLSIHELEDGLSLAHDRILQAEQRMEAAESHLDYISARAFKARQVDIAQRLEAEIARRKAEKAAAHD